jgi:hypothetical protein
VKKHVISYSVTAALMAATTPAHADSSMVETVIGYLVGSGKANGDFRLRYETVTQDNPIFTNNDNPTEDDTSSALTLRSRLGYKTAVYKGFDAFLEFENVAVYDNEDYRTDPSITNPQRPVIADPESTEVNQKWLGFSAIPKTVLRYGRQRVIYDNARFIGNVGWRQNEQTFDGLSAVITAIPDTTLSMMYVTNVNRITGDDAINGDYEMASTFFNINYAGWEFGKFTAYAYLLDFENALNNGFAKDPSTDTYGGRFTGNYKLNDDLSLVYSAEYAKQSNAADNEVEADVNYLLLEPGVTFHGITGLLGYEVLGSDEGVAAFQTPLATLHAFNGWADMWLGTPNKGLVDMYLVISTTPVTPLALKFSANYHSYESDQDGDDYGSEMGGSVVKNIGDNTALTLKYAKYSATDETEALMPAGARKFDTTKLWVSAETKF